MKKIAMGMATKKFTSRYNIHTPNTTIGRHTKSHDKPKLAQLATRPRNDKYKETGTMISRISIWRSRRPFSKFLRLI
jgi:hypothetical protein